MQAAGSGGEGRSSPDESIEPLCGFFPQTARARVFAASLLSLNRQLQFISVKDVFQIRLVESSLLEQLFDTHLVLGSPNAGCNGNYMLGPKNLAPHALVLDRLRLTYSLFREAVGGLAINRLLRWGFSRAHS